MPKVRWGVLGCSRFADGCTIPALKEARNVELVGIASRSIERADQFRVKHGLPQAYRSYEELLDDPTIQAVYIPLPNGLHAEWAIRAVAHGKHVVSEKPIAANAQEVVSIRDAARQHDRHVMEGFMWRFHPQHIEARRAVRDGEIGTVRLVRVSFSFPFSRDPDSRWDPALGGGSIMDVGCYCISACRYYFLSEPETVYARGTIDSEFHVDTSMAGELEFANGRALIDCSFTQPFRTDLEVVGDKGVIRCALPFTPGPTATVVINGCEHVTPQCNQYALEFEHVSECVLTGATPRYGMDDALAQMQVVDAVRASVASGQPTVVASA